MIKWDDFDPAQIGQAVDMKENDIWWQGVVWDQFPDRLRVYLPGAPPHQLLHPCTAPVLPRLGYIFFTVVKLWLKLGISLGCSHHSSSRSRANVLPPFGFSAVTCLSSGKRFTGCQGELLCRAGRFLKPLLCPPRSAHAQIISMLSFDDTPARMVQRWTAPSRP